LSWEQRANCRGKGTNLFYPETGGSTVQKAKRICRDCPVREPCLEYALQQEDLHGIWGGLSPDEREELLKLRAPITTPTCDLEHLLVEPNLTNPAGPTGQYRRCLACTRARAWCRDQQVSLSSLKIISHEYYVKIMSAPRPTEKPRAQQMA
jgi:WhiB family redox-sensing transcriptional regulator